MISPADDELQDKAAAGTSAEPVPADGGAEPDPAVVPRAGAFFMHDDRSAAVMGAASAAADGHATHESHARRWNIAAGEKWTHDRFDADGPPIRGSKSSRGRGGRSKGDRSRGSKVVKPMVIREASKHENEINKSKGRGKSEELAGDSAPLQNQSNQSQLSPSARAAPLKNDRWQHQNDKGSGRRNDVAPRSELSRATKQSTRKPKMQNSAESSTSRLVQEKKLPVERGPMKNQTARSSSQRGSRVDRLQPRNRVPRGPLTSGAVKRVHEPLSTDSISPADEKQAENAANHRLAMNPLAKEFVTVGSSLFEPEMHTPVFMPQSPAPLNHHDVDLHRSSMSSVQGAAIEDLTVDAMQFVQVAPDGTPFGIDGNFGNPYEMPLYMMPPPLEYAMDGGIFQQPYMMNSASALPPDAHTVFFHQLPPTSVQFPVDIPLASHYIQPTSMADIGTAPPNY